LTSPAGSSSRFVVQPIIAALTQQERLKLIEELAKRMAADCSSGSENWDNQKFEKW
jgi:hypothetical protein